LFSHLNFSIFIQPLKLIWCNMLSSSQVQLSNQSCASNISTTTFINNHTTYLIFYVTSIMKDILPLLINIFFTNLKFKDLFITKDSPLTIYSISLASLSADMLSHSNSSLTASSLKIVILLFGHSNAQYSSS
jgi:hypothetical protein